MPKEMFCVLVLVEHLRLQQEKHCLLSWMVTGIGQALAADGSHVASQDAAGTCQEADGLGSAPCRGLPEHGRESTGEGRSGSTVLSKDLLERRSQTSCDLHYGAHVERHLGTLTDFVVAPYCQQRLDAEVRDGTADNASTDPADILLNAPKKDSSCNPTAACWSSRYLPTARRESGTWWQMIDLCNSSQSLFTFTLC